MEPRTTREVALDIIVSEQITVTSGAAIGITAALLSDPPKNYAIIQVRNADIMYRLDGTDPDATTGAQIFAGVTETIKGINNLRRLRMIAPGGDATVFIQLTRT